MMYLDIFNPWSTWTHLIHDVHGHIQAIFRPGCARTNLSESHLYCDFHAPSTHYNSPATTWTRKRYYTECKTILHWMQTIWRTEAVGGMWTGHKASIVPPLVRHVSHHYLYTCGDIRIQTHLCHLTASTITSSPFTRLDTHNNWTSIKMYIFTSDITMINKKNPCRHEVNNVDQ